MRNTIGNLLTLTTFGESHGPAMGGVLDGVPAGVPIDLDALQRAVDRRRPGQSSLTTARNEPDRVEILSGIYQGKTLGTPIGFIVRNTDARPADYDAMAQCYRPSHADYTWEARFGIRDPRGGGRASARETVARVVGGALAAQVLATRGVTVTAYTSAIGDVTLDPAEAIDLSTIDHNPVRCPHAATAQRMADAIEQARSEGDTLGGIVTLVVHGMPAGVGEPVFGKLHAQLASALMSINAARAVEIGDGMAMARMRGSEAMDLFTVEDGRVRTLTNHSGGIQGGITNGEDIIVRVAFKPIATLMRDIPTIDRDLNPVTLHPTGRHDVCVVPRAVPIVEAMAALVLLDNMMPFGQLRELRDES